MVDGNSRKRPNGVQAFVSEREFRRKPRGTRDGGRFGAGRITSEPVIELVEGEHEVGYEPDGSKAFEERSRRADSASSDQVVDQVAEVAVEPDDVVEVIPTIVEVEPIVLGGKKEFGEGSWSFPPPWNDVEKLAHFFATVEISDSSIANVEGADRTGRDAVAAYAEYDQWSRSQPGITSRFRRKLPEEAEALSAD